MHQMWARRHGTKFNGAPYIVQRAGEAVYSEAGKAQLKEQVAYYNEKCSSHQRRTAERRLRGVWRCERTIYLVKDTGSDDILGFLRLSA